MELAVRLIPLGRPSLVESIAGLGAKFLAIRDELQNARIEIAKLKNKLAQLRNQREVLPVSDVAVLRRRIAYYCHPDRGGDVGLMREINILFDALENQEIKNA